MDYHERIKAYKESLPLLQDFIPGLSKERGGECFGGCPSCGSSAESDRFRVFVKEQRYWCRHEGCELNDKGGDIIDFIEKTTGADLGTQLREAGFLDDFSEITAKQKKNAAPKTKKVEESGGVGIEKKRKKNNKAAWIWAQSRESPEPYEYLERTRGVKVSRNSEIKFNSYTDKEGLEHSMVVLRLSKPGDKKEPQCIQRIFLKKEEGDWAKTGTAICNSTERAAVGRAVWFGGNHSPKVVAAGEGPETMLSVAAATGMDSISCLTASGLKNVQFHEETEDIYFFIDCDQAQGKNGGPGFAGQKAGIAAALRAEKHGKRAFIVTPSSDTFGDNPVKVDFNDLYRADPSGQSIRDRVADSVPVGNIDWKPPKVEKKDNGAYPPGTVELLEEMNSEYAACLVSGKFRISREYRSETRGFHSVEFLEIGSFKNFLANKKCNVFVGDYGKTKKAGLADTWMEWDGRKSYKTVVFDPNNNLSGESYNLWKGFAVKPIKGDWELFKSHMFQVLCEENNEYFEYLMAWMARIVQDPGGKRPGVAVVLQGNKGSGKGTFFNGFGKLFGESYVHVSTSKGLTGDFNMHLSKGVLVFADEARWAGDKAAEGRLKALVTEDTIDFEPKGIDRLEMRCHANLGIACNDEWAVNATEDERRYFVLKALTKDFMDTAYFNAIHEELENGGYEAMMFELLHHDFSHVNLRKAPVTDGLISQIEESLPRTLEFWHEVLSRGFLLSDSHSGAPVESQRGLGVVNWPRSAWKYEIAYEFKEVFDKRSRFPAKGPTFWKETKKFWDFEETQPLDNERKRQRAITIPSLEELRQLFTGFTGIKFGEEDRDRTETERFF